MKNFCYAVEGSLRLDFFIKTKTFYNFNDLLNHIKNKNAQLLSYEEIDGIFRATFKYKK